ncbi:hypothetical protein EDD36DRAFT_474717, partial [Exophiala viscosa]
MSRTLKVGNNDFHMMSRTEQTSRKRGRSASVHSREVQPRLEHARHNNMPVSLKEGHRKASAACETCRLKKVKCNEGWPLCSYCSRHGFRCDYAKQRPLRYSMVTAVSIKDAADGESHEIPYTLLLERLVLAECRLKQLELSSRVQNHRSTTPASDWSGPDDASSPLQLWSEPGRIAAPQHSLRTLPEMGSADITSPVEKAGCSSSEALTRSYYLGRAPLACEEERPPFPDLVLQEQQASVDDVMPAVKQFHDYVGMLYPILCDSTMLKLSNAVLSQGFGENLHSCLILLLIAMTKAHEKGASVDSGLLDFQRAMQLHTRLSAKLSLDYVQTLCFSALFLLRKSRLLDFIITLHSCCTMLHILITRDQGSGINRPRNERNMIESLFWVCRNLERDVVNEIDDTLPSSNLVQYEELFSLPLPCEESVNNMPTYIRNIY